MSIDLKEKIQIQPNIIKNVIKKESNILYTAPLSFRNAQLNS